MVSSDREIASHAWANGSVPVASEEFLPFAEGLFDDKSRMDGDEGEAEQCRKGNPKQLSRKEKAVKRALLRL